MNAQMSGWDAAKAAAASPVARVSDSIRDALLAWLKGDGASDYEKDRLHYGADLWPGICERKVWYGVHGTAQDPPRLGDELRFKGGRVFENVVADAIAATGVEVLRQVLVRPLRPSAWAWSPGRGDLLLVATKHLLEIKAPRAALFHRAKGDPKKLVKDTYRWQLSSYYHELKRRGRVETASWLFLDREGSHEPVEVKLEGELLIPLEEIVAEEERKAALITRDTPPDRISGTVEVRVWKGGRKTKVNPSPERRVEAVELQNWQCRYCNFRSTCTPGPEERVLDLEDGNLWRRRAVELAEEAWANGAKTTPFVARFGPDDEDHDREGDGPDATNENPQCSPRASLSGEPAPRPEGPALEEACAASSEPALPPGPGDPGHEYATWDPTTRRFVTRPDPWISRMDEDGPPEPTVEEIDEALANEDSGW